ncbi:hypothetical protein DFH28DRAFT_1136581 [Melampsora americana]|nr:hypothetical protein DFH28DRAFT_1136581 [Melampsora americana]
MSEYDDAMDALTKTKSLPQSAMKTPSTRQLAALKKVTLAALPANGLSPSASTTPRSSAPLSRDRKRTRLATPPICPFLERLVEVTKATLIPKSKKTNSIKVDIESAADILLLTGLIKEQSVVSTIAERVDVLSDHIAKLVANGHPEQSGKKQAPSKTSYASLLQSMHPTPIPPLGVEKTIPELIKVLNLELSSSKILLKPEDTKPIEVRNVHRHPSGDLVIYLDSQRHAQSLRSQEKEWLHKISPNLAIKQELHAIIVHGEPTTFNPSRKEDIDLLKTCNGDLLDE